VSTSIQKHPLTSQVPKRCPCPMRNRDSVTHLNAKAVAPNKPVDDAEEAARQEKHSGVQGIPPDQALADVADTAVTVQGNLGCLVDVELFSRATVNAKGLVGRAVLHQVLDQALLNDVVPYAEGYRRSLHPLAGLMDRDRVASQIVIIGDVAQPDPELAAVTKNFPNPVPQVADDNGYFFNAGRGLYHEGIAYQRPAPGIQQGLRIPLRQDTQPVAIPSCQNNAFHHPSLELRVTSYTLGNTNLPTANPNPNIPIPQASTNRSPFHR